jgi:hypothetical protein
MALNLGNTRIDAGNVYEMLHDPAGPVGLLIGELSTRATAVAQANAHVYPGTPGSTIWNPRTSTAILPPGTTRDSVQVHWPQIGSRGGLFGGVDANLLPTVFLEPVHRYKSAQMHDRYPFMTTGLDSIEGAI